MKTQTPLSEAFLPRAQRWTPGASQTGSKAPGRSGPTRDYPLFLTRGLGATVWDMDSNMYMDMIGGLAAVGLGHADPQVVKAAHQALATGSLLSLPSPDEALAAEALCDAIGRDYAESVRWVKTGSESTEAAVRVARCATGRMRVLTPVDGYHSWHSWYQASKQHHPGVPQTMADLIDVFEYGAVPRSLLQTREYAAVILEPVPITGEPAGMDVAAYLRELVNAAHDAGTLVIFDEVVWGFRAHRGGMGARYGVDPDLATFGKALGNGIPVGALVGRHDLMEHATLVSGTFGGDRVALAAAMVVMARHLDGGAARHMADMGSLFAQEVNARCAGTDLSLRVDGEPSHPILRLQVGAADAAQQRAAMSLLLQAMARRGLLFHPAGGNVMACMTPFDIGFAARAVEAGWRVVREAIERGGHDEVRRQLAGDPYSPAFSRAQVQA